jgi:hypothetical protein
VPNFIGSKLAQRRRGFVLRCMSRAAWLNAAVLVAGETMVALDAILANDRVNGCPLANVERARIGQARRLAVYLAVVHFGLTQSEIARAAGMSRQQVFTACRRVEDDRDADAIDALLDAIAGRLPVPSSGSWRLQTG